MASSIRPSICIGVSGALLLAAAVTRAAPADDAASGIWEKREYSLAYMGFTSTYSCDGLADKVKVLLLAAGARADATSRAGACASGFGRPDKFARADLTFYVLVPGVPADANTPISGTWRPVTLTRRQPRELASGDCELVEQFTSKVLPLFTIRNLVSRTTCVPHQDSGSSIDVSFESLTASPSKRQIAKPVKQGPSSS